MYSTVARGVNPRFVASFVENGFCDVSPKRRGGRSLQQLAHAPLAVVLVHGDLQSRGPHSRAALEGRQEPLTQKLRKQFGRGVADRQQDTIAARKYPAASVRSEYGFDLAFAFCHANQGMTRGQENVVIKLVSERFQLIAQGDEVDDVLVFVERPFDFDRYTIVVPVQPLAHVAIERDEMRGAEDVLLFFEADAVHALIIARAAARGHPANPQIALQR
jgi:hypothetical protein